MFYSLGLKMSELSHCVHKKRIELQGLVRVKAIKKIVEPQVNQIWLSHLDNKKSDWEKTCN